MSSNFVLEANRLKNIQTNLEKSEVLLLEHLKKHGDTNVLEFREHLEIERKKALDLIQIEIINILNPISKFKSLTSSQKIPNLDYTEIKKDMTLVSENIKYFSQSVKLYLDKLRKDEKTCEEDVKAYEIRITDWEKPINLTQSTLDSSYSRNDKLEQNVTDFLYFLSKTGGHTNGWSSDDHNLFLKARSKYKDINDLCKHVHKVLPDISEDAIYSHEKWYIKYLEMKQKQKQSIQTWRNAKSAVVLTKPHSESKEKRPSSAYNRKTMSRLDIQAKLEKWRQEKIERTENERMLQNEMAKHKREIEEKRKQKQEEIKKVIENWKIEKLEKVEKELCDKLTTENQQKLFKSAMANRLIKEFQSQDEIFIKRRIECCKPKSKSVERIANNVHVVRDPSRLLKPTKQWISRIKSSEENNKLTNNNNSTSIKTIPRLGIPGWRKNISVAR